MVQIPVEVTQGCLLQHFLESSMYNALKEHGGKVNIGGRTIINLRFADDIDVLAGE